MIKTPYKSWKKCRNVQRMYVIVGRMCRNFRIDVKIPAVFLLLLEESFMNTCFLMYIETVTGRKKVEVDDKLKEKNHNLFQYGITGYNL